MNVFLISEDKIKTETVVCDNTDSMYIGPAIESAQEVGLQQLIGTQLYNKLCDLVENGQITQEDHIDYKILLDTYITPYLKYKVCSEMTMMIAYKYRNSGVIQTNDEYTTNTSMKDAQTMKDFYDQKASFFAIKLSKYLVSNSNKYIEYTQAKNEDIKANKDAYNTGIYLG